MIRALGWLGRHAPVVLIVGCVIAFVFPWLASIMRPALPVFVAVVIGSSMAQLNPRQLLPSILSLSRLPSLIAMSLVLMPATSLIYALVFWLVGVSDTYREFAIILAAAPPIASAAALCQFIGLNSRRALEVSFVATILTPLLGPLVFSILLPELDMIDSLGLAARLAMIIAGGWVIAIIINHLAVKPEAGPPESESNQILNGISATAMILFLIPVFDGVGSRVIESPMAALSVLGLAVFLNLGVNGIVYLGTSVPMGRRDAGTLGLLWGNRNAAIYLAALPPDPHLGLFIALYQFPMYATPLLVRMLIRYGKRIPQTPR